MSSAAYSDFLTAVKKGDFDTFKKLLSHVDPTLNMHLALKEAACGGYNNIVTLLLPTSDQAALNVSLYVAFGERHLDVIKTLLPLSDDPDIYEKLLTRAAKDGHTDMVNFLLPFADPKANDSQALADAALKGHLDIVRLLLPLSDPKADNSGALQAAAHKGYIDIVNLLLPLSDPKAGGSDALYWAARANHFSVINVLYSVSDLSVVIKKIKRNKKKSEGFLYLERLLKAEEEKNFLSDNIMHQKIKSSIQKKL